MESDARVIAEERENSDLERSSMTVMFPRRAGRPSLTGQSEESPQVSFRFSQDVREKAQREAAKQGGTTVSALAREALKSYLYNVGSISRHEARAIAIFKIDLPKLKESLPARILSGCLSVKACRFSLLRLWA
jgi:hypothetical protein